MPCLLEYDLNTLLKGGGLGKWLTGWKRSANLASKSIDPLFKVLLLLSPLIDECLGGGGGAPLLLLLFSVLCWGIWNIIQILFSLSYKYKAEFTILYVIWKYGSSKNNIDIVNKTQTYFEWILFHKKIIY